jgi:hypothetical protein
MNSSNNTDTDTDTKQYSALHMDGWKHEWNVNGTLDNDAWNSITARISEYYHAESTKTKTPSFSRHHALILAALSSSSKLVSRAFPATVVSGYERQLTLLPTQQQQMFTTALTSTYQKGHLTALSGMTGLLVTRLLMPTTPQIISLKTKKTHAEITQHYIHSALAAEYLLGNRYYRRASVTTTTTTPLEKEKHPVGFLDCDVKSNRAATAATGDNVTQEELHQLYNANIARLSFMIQQYKRGFVCRDTIRTDPEFVRLMSAFWRLARQLLKMNDDFEAQAANPLTRMWFSSRKNARRLTMVSIVAETGVLVPGLYDYDVAHIFDNASGSYVNYIHTVKSTWIRLAGDGSNASFLAFAAIEPTMVTEDRAPRIGGNPAEYHGLSLMSCANYIQSRDPVFGALKKRHSCHMIRTADAVNMSFGQVHPYQLCSPARGVCRDQERFQPRYAPFYEMVEDARRKETILGNVDWNFEEKCENTGEIVSAFEGIREFRERVWPSVGRGIISEYTLTGENDHDDDDDYYYDRDNDDGRYYHNNPREYDDERDDSDYDDYGYGDDSD